MRIIAGDWKGRRLKALRGLQTRPTSDKVKGAVFNVLGDKVCGAKVLDLFAGTGNLSWEALSRGAEQAVLIEKNPAALAVAAENQALLGAENKARIIKMDAFAFLSQCQEPFDLVFLDPPYRQGIVDQALAVMKQKKMLNPGGVIIAETASSEQLENKLHPLEIRITKEYGDTKVWFLQEAME